MNTNTCKDISRLISEGMDRGLTFRERVRLRIHLLRCKGCANFDKQMRILRTAARKYIEQTFPDRKP